MASSRRVLIVDEDRYFRETIRDALLADGVDCELATGGVEARKAIADPKIACVVLDVRVETPDSLGLLDALLRARPALRVIALSGHSDQELVLAALRRGASDYLAKPLHDEELCLAVRRALDGYDALSRWERARERVGRLAELCTEIATDAGGETDHEGVASRAASAIAEVFGVSRAAAGRAVEAGEIPGVGEDGEALGEEDRALLRLFTAAAAGGLASPARAPAADAPGPPGSEEADLLREIAEAATREVEPGKLLAASLRPVARLAKARAAGIFLIDNATGRLLREAGFEGSDVERTELPRDSGLTGGCLQAGRLVATDHPEREPRYDEAVDTPESGAPGPLLVIPLRVRERVLGVARVFPGPGAGVGARLAELCAAPLAAATRNVLLYRSLLESVEDVARARREAEAERRA